MIDEVQVHSRRHGSGLRLVQFHVDKLFDEFTYTIPLNLKSHVTAIIAPNGAGKTLCLRMISALFEKKWGVFTANAFTTAVYKFSDGSSVIVEQTATDLLGEDASVRRPLRITIYGSSGNRITEWVPPLHDPRRTSTTMERHLPFLTRVGPDTWRNDHTGETVNTQEVIETYGHMIPEAVRERFFGKAPDELTAITNQIDCHLIETQRLLILREDLNDPYRRSSRPPSTLAIARKAQALKSIISNEINVYATLSQSLDRSFPKRVITHPTMLPSEDLKARLQDLDISRRELMAAGILDTEADDPVGLPEGPLETAIARVLSVYVDDTRTKLSSLQRLLEKIKLFKELIDERFVTKDVHITRQNGIEVAYNGRNVPLEGLSSGEQHQLVLFFELLFEIKHNSLILIDEPELSLHVAWQKKFIGDLLKIISLNEFDVILATHSPQLIGRWNDLVIELGDVYEGEGQALGDDQE